MNLDNQNPDAQGDIYSLDCIDSIKMQMAAMKANSEGIKANHVFEEVSFNSVDFPDFEADYKCRHEQQDFEPPEYNQTKYINLKANAKPLFNRKSTKLARNNIKQKQKWPKE